MNIKEFNPRILQDFTSIFINIKEFKRRDVRSFYVKTVLEALRFCPIDRREGSK